MRGKIVRTCNRQRESSRAKAIVMNEKCVSFRFVPFPILASALPVKPSSSSPYAPHLTVAHRTIRIYTLGPEQLWFNTLYNPHPTPSHHSSSQTHNRLLPKHLHHIPLPQDHTPNPPPPALHRRGAELHDRAPPHLRRGPEHPILALLPQAAAAPGLGSRRRRLGVRPLRGGGAEVARPDAGLGGELGQEEGGERGEEGPGEDEGAEEREGVHLGGERDCGCGAVAGEEDVVAQQQAVGGGPELVARGEGGQGPGLAAGGAAGGEPVEDAEGGGGGEGEALGLGVDAGGEGLEGVGEEAEGGGGGEVDGEGLGGGKGGGGGFEDFGVALGYEGEFGGGKDVDLGGC